MDNLSIFTKLISNYELNLNNPEENEDIDKIYSIMNKLIELIKDKRNILNYNEIFESMLSTFSNRELNDFYKLNKILNIKNNSFNQNIIERFYNKVHHKGLSLIKSHDLNLEQIRIFLTEQDIYYYSEKFENNENRDPEIFKYIKITDEDENYLDNINFIKKNNFWYLFQKNYKM